MRRIALSRFLSKKANQPFIGLIDIRGNKECWPWLGLVDKDGYGIFINRRAHRHMAKLMHLGDIEGTMVIHRCDNPPCCNPRHLRVGNHVDNMRDRATRDRVAKGVGNGRAKLTADQVREIRATSGTVRDIAEKYGLNYGTIADIRARRTWRSVK